MDRFEKEIRWPTVVWVIRLTHMGSDGVNPRVSILGVVLSLTVACNPVAAPEPTIHPHFPQQREAEGRVAKEALMEAELVLEDGCLRAKKMKGTDYLLIWPPGFKLSVDGGDVRVSDDTGTSLSVGEEVRIGGGGVSLTHVQVLVEQPLPHDCPGPYWIVGEIPGPR